MTVRLLQPYGGDDQYPTGLAANRLYTGRYEDYFVEIGTADRQLTLSPDFSAYYTASSIYPVGTKVNFQAADDAWAASRGVLGLSAVKVAASTRCGALGGLTDPNKSSGTSITATYRIWHQVGPVSIADPVLKYGNWMMTQASGELVGDNTITVKSALEYNGASYPAFSRGARTMTVEAGAESSFDPIPLVLPAGAEYWERVYVTSNGVASGKWPLGRSGDQVTANRDSNNYASPADAADGTGALGTLGGVLFGAISITGTPASPVPFLGFLGDSIPAGTGCTADVVAGNSYLGFLERAIKNSFPWISATRAGYQYANIGINSRAMALFGSHAVTTVIDELGRNDIASGTALAALQALAISTWNALAQRGIRVFKTTITPISTSSTDGYTSVNNQTVTNAGWETVRVAFNAWLRAGAPIVAGVAVAIGTSGALLMSQAGHPLYGIIEVSDAVESVRDSGKWRVGPNARVINDASIAGGTRTLTSASANFTSADIGTGVFITGPGVAGADLATKIGTVTNATTVVLVQGGGASTTVSGAAMRIGGVTGDGVHPNDGGATLAGVPVIATTGQFI